MKKLIVGIIILIGILSALILLRVFPNNKTYVEIDNKKFYVDVANTDSQKEKGLSIYNKMPIDKGMLFPFNDYSAHPFWMKGMKFSIDIIYIQNNKIVNIFENLPFPKSENETPIIVKSTVNSNYVLEINAGLSKKYKFKKGDLVKLKL